MVTLLLLAANSLAGPQYYYKDFPPDSYYNPMIDGRCLCNEDGKPTEKGSVVDMTNGQVTLEDFFPVYPTVGEPITLIRRHLSYANPAKTEPYSIDSIATGAGGGLTSTVYTSDVSPLPNFGKGAIWSYYEYIREPALAIANCGGGQPGSGTLYDMSTGNKYLTLYKGNHMVLVYRQSSTNPILFYPLEGVKDKIIMEDTIFRRITEDGITFGYERKRALSATEGKLLYVQEQHGHRINISYGIPIIRITDASGNGFDLHYVTYNDTKYISRVEVGGRSWTYTYDYSEGNLTAVSDNTLGRTTRYSYDNSHRIKSVSYSWSPISTAYVYDTYGKCTQRTEVNRETSQTKTWYYAYDSANFKATAIDPSGVATYYEYTAQTWQLSKVTRGGKVLVQLTHDAHYNKTYESIGNANYGMSYAYDTHDNLIQMTDPYSKQIQYQWDTTLSRVTSIIDPIGNKMSYSYNTCRDMLSSRNGLGDMTQYKYNSDGTLSQVTNALNQVYNFEYGTKGLMTRAISPDASTTLFVYDTEEGLKTQQVGPLGHTVTFAWDKDKRLISAVTTQDGAVTQYGYEPVHDQLQWVCDARGNTTYRYYNAYGQCTGTRNPLGMGDTYLFDVLGQVTSTRDPMGNIFAYYHDALGHVTTEVVGDYTTRHYYDSLNRETTIWDSRSGFWHQQYDNLNRVVAEWGPDQCTVSRGYWDFGSRLCTIDPAQNTTYYIYDANKRIFRSYNANFNQWAIFGYDPLGRIIERQDQNGVFTDYYYNTNGNPTTLLWWKATDNFNRADGVNLGNSWYPVYGAWSIKHSQLLIEDQSNWQVVLNSNTQTYSNPTMESSYLITSGSGNIADFVFGYQNSSNYYFAGVMGSNTNPSDRQVFIAQFSNGNLTVDTSVLYPYVEMGQKNRMKLSVNGQWARLSHWESSGWKEVLAKQYPSNIPTGKVGLGSGFAHVYFDDFLLNNGKTVLQRMDYTYDKEGKRTQSKDKDNNTVTYAYDNMHHLSSETGPGYHKEYQYDLAGNRERLISGTHTTYYYYNTFNQLTARNWAGYADMLDIKNYHYDDNGNMYAGSNSDDNNVKQMGWNPYGEMTYFQKWVNTVLLLDSYYYYDPYGHRYQRDYWSPEYPQQRLTQNQYYYDGNNVIQEREIYQGATVSNTYYHSLPSSLNRVISIRKGGIDYWYHTDPIGNVLFISDSTGSIIATYNQEAFGNIISSTGYADNDLHLHERGQEDGYIDLYYFGARWYDPELGRWLSPEPLGLDGPNLYQFCFNDPVNGVDENGLWFKEHIVDPITQVIHDSFGGGIIANKAAAQNAIDDVLNPEYKDKLFNIDELCCFRWA